MQSKDYKNFVFQEERKRKKEKKRCAKLYPDWRDDEFNCGPLKFIWGVSHSSENLQATSFYSINDMELVYNRDTKHYLLQFDTSLLHDEKNFSTLLSLWLKAFEKYLRNSNIDYTAYTVDPIIFDDADMFSDTSISQLYLKFKIIVKGCKAVSKIKVSHEDNN